MFSLNYKYKKTIISIFSISIILFLVSLPNRVLFIDDHWFAEQAFWLLQDGVVRSELFGGFLDYEIQQFAYHKLHIWQAALTFKLFGFSIYALKSVELFFLMFFLTALYFYFKKYFPVRNGLLLFIISCALLFSNSLLVEEAFNYRPEASLMFLGFLSFLFLRYTLDREDDKYWHIILSGIFSGFAVLYHLIGLVFIFSGVGLLATQNKHKHIIIFISASLAISSIYFYDIIAANALDKFVHQFSFDPARETNTLGILQYPYNIFLEIKHLFRNQKEGTYATLLIVLVIFNWEDIKNNREIFLVFIYLLFTFLTLAMISPGKRIPNYYLLIYMPYVIIIMSFCISRLHTQMPKIRVLISIILVSYILSNWSGTLKLIKVKRPTPETNRIMFTSLNIENAKSVAGPVTLVFNEIKNVKLYATRTYFIKVEKGFIDLSVDSFFADMASRSVDYVILDERYREKLQLGCPEAIKNNSGYTFYRNYYDHNLKDADNKLYVFKKY